MNAKFAKPEHDHHAVRLLSDGQRGELLVVRRGRHAYVWAGVIANGHLAGVVTFSGQQTLRKLARLILKNVPAAKPRPKRKRGLAGKT